MNDRNVNRLSISEFPGFPNCFVCGKDNPRGLRISFSVEEDGVRASFSPDKTLVGFEDIIHGGVISALLDEAIIWAAYAATRRFGVTAELNIRFHKPLTVQEEYILKGRMVEDRGKLWIVESVITDEEGNQYAGATGKLVPKS